VLNIEHGRALCPGVFVVGEVGGGFQAAEAGGMKGLGNWGVLHHHATVKTGAPGSTVQPKNDGVRDFLSGRLEHPEHSHETGAVVVVRRQHASVHLSIELSVRRLDIFQTNHEEIIRLGKGVVWEKSLFRATVNERHDGVGATREV